MNNVIQFPKIDPKWRSVEIFINDTFLQSGLTKEQTLEFKEFFKPIFDSFKFNYEFSISVPDDGVAIAITEHLNNLSTSIREHLDKMIIDRLTRELEFYIFNITRH